jgi:predicted RNA binding protein YcfA (HicA-like mRNA interferase family)
VPKLPAISGRRLIAILKREGFEEIRQRGSHVSLAKGRFRTVVPLHDDLSKGTLLAILDQCGLTRDDLLRLLRE